MCSNFLEQWADYQYDQPASWTGADNGALQILLLKNLLPSNRPEIDACNEMWSNSSDYDTYMRYVTCCKVNPLLVVEQTLQVSLGTRRLWPPYVLLYRRAHGWVQDGFITQEHWCERNFMFHGWKKNEIGADGWKSPFTVCGGSVRDCPNPPPARSQWRRLRTGQCVAVAGGHTGVVCQD